MELYQVTCIDKYKHPSIDREEVYNCRIFGVQGKATRPLGRTSFLACCLAMSPRQILIDLRIELNAQCKSYSNEIVMELLSYALRLVIII